MLSCVGVRAEYFENGVKGSGTLVNEPGMTGGVAEGRTVPGALMSCKAVWSSVLLLTVLFEKEW